MIKWRMKNKNFFLFAITLLFFQINVKNSPQSHLVKITKCPDCDSLEESDLLNKSENHNNEEKKAKIFKPPDLTLSPNINKNQTFLSSSTNSTKCDRACFLEKYLGPRTKNLMFTITMSTVYTVILITGILGNISTCLVIIFNDSMHTTTNYYIFSLAVSDVLFLIIGLPMELHGLIVGSYPWVFGQTLCILRTFFFEATTICSVLTILTFTFERWLHICKSIYAKKFSNSFSRAIKIILFIWSISGLSAIPFALMSGVFYAINEDYPESKICATLNEYHGLLNTAIKLSVLLFFIVPMTLISNMYILIGIKLWNSQDKIKSINTKNDGSDMRNKFRFTCYLFKNKNEKKNGLEQQSLDSQNDDQKTEEYINVLSKKSVKQTKKNTNLENIGENQRQSRRDVIKMLFVVVLGFFICWMPFHLQRLWTTIVVQISNVELFEFLYYVSGISIYISSIINPILYNLMSKRYRTAFIATFKMILSCKKPNQNQKYHGSYLYFYNKNKIENLHHRARVKKIHNPHKSNNNQAGDIHNNNSIKSNSKKNDINVNV